MCLFQHFVDEIPTVKHPDPIPATGEQLYEARPKPKKRKMETENRPETCDNSESAVLTEHSNTNEKGTQQTKLVSFVRMVWNMSCKIYKVFQTWSSGSLGQVKLCLLLCPILYKQ